MTGRLGEDRDLAYGVKAAERCALLLIAQVKLALGNLERVARIVKLGAFVNSAADFTDQPQVATSASDLMQHVFGEAGRHGLRAAAFQFLRLAACLYIDAIDPLLPSLTSVY